MKKWSSGNYFFIFLCTISISTLFWGKLTSYSIVGQVIISVVAPLTGLSTVHEYLFDKTLHIGLIKIPIGIPLFREIGLLFSIFMIVLPLIIVTI